MEAKGHNHNNLLAVAIPTYNRSRYLEENLETLVPQFQKYNLPIYIYDNHSDDDTKSIVEKFQNTYKNVFYVRNEVNIGMYSNVLKAINQTNAEYVWILGDDDQVIENAIDDLIPYLSKAYSFIILNSVAFDKTLTRVKRQQVINIKYDKEYESRDGHEFLLLDLSPYAYHAFISSMIMKKETIIDVVMEMSERKFKYFGNTWLPIMYLYRSIIGKRGIFIAKPIIRNRDNGRATGTDDWHYFTLDYIIALESLQEFGYRHKTIVKSIATSPKLFFSAAVQARFTKPEIKLFNTNLKHDNFIGITSKIILFFVDIAPFTFIKLAYGILNQLVRRS